MERACPNCPIYENRPDSQALCAVAFFMVASEKPETNRWTERAEQENGKTLRSSLWDLSELALGARKLERSRIDTARQCATQIFAGQCDLQNLDPDGSIGNAINADIFGSHVK